MFTFAVESDDKENIVTVVSTVNPDPVAAKRNSAFMALGRINIFLSEWSAVHFPRFNYAHLPMLDRHQFVWTARAFKIRPCAYTRSANIVSVFAADSANTHCTDEHSNS